MMKRPLTMRRLKPATLGACYGQVELEVSPMIRTTLIAAAAFVAAVGAASLGTTLAQPPSTARPSAPDKTKADRPTVIRPMGQRRFMRSPVDVDRIMGRAGGGGAPGRQCP